MKMRFMQAALGIVFVLTNTNATAQDVEEEAQGLAKAAQQYVQEVRDYAVAYRGRPPSYSTLWKEFGAKEAEQAVLQAAIEEDDDGVDATVLRLFQSSHPFPPEMSQIAARSLHAENPKLRVYASAIIARRDKHFRKEILVRARQVALDTFSATKGQHGYDALRKLATPADVRAIRAVYKISFRQLTHDGQEEEYLCSQYVSNTSKPTRSQVLVMLLRLGDQAAFREVHEAVTQPQNPQTAIWGWYMVEQVSSPDLLHKLRHPLLTALDDERTGAEPLGCVTDPEAKGFRLRANVYLRVCDFAVRAAYGSTLQDRPWGFVVPKYKQGVTGPWDGVHEDVFETYRLKEAATPKEHNEEGKFFERDWIVGFSEEQIEEVRQYVKESLVVDSPSGPIGNFVMWKDKTIALACA